RPKLGGWIVGFRAGKSDVAIAESPCHENLAVRQQRGGVNVARGDQRAAYRPVPGGRIVYLGTVGSSAARDAASHHHLAIGQQSYGVINPRAVQRIGRYPGSGRRIT